MQTRLETDPQWKKLLDDVAVEVDRLIDPDQGGHLQPFQEKIRGFVKRAEANRKALDRRESQHIRHWQQIKQHSEWRIKNRRPPKKGWEWDSEYLSGIPTPNESCKIILGDYFPDNQTHAMPYVYAEGFLWAVDGYIYKNSEKLKEFKEHAAKFQKLDKTIAQHRKHIKVIQSQLDALGAAGVGTTLLRAPARWWRYLGLQGDDFWGCWRPPLVVVPDYPVDRLGPPDDGMELPRPRDEAEEYEQYYAVLASIHDNRLPATKGITDGIWPKDLAEQVWGRLSLAQPYGPDEPFIKVALDRVTADLPADPPPRSKSGDTAGGRRGGSRQSQKTYESQEQILL